MRDTLPRFSKALKSVIEQRSGLALGDAVNVALFVLTVVSLFLAVLGVVIAILTLRDARKSGDAQLELLKQSRQSLASAETSLSKQNGILSSNLALNEVEQGTLTQSLSLATQQLGILSSQNAREAEFAARRPRASLRVSCGSQSDRFESRQIDEKLDMKHGYQENVSVRLNEERIMRCDFDLENNGTAVLSEGFVEFTLEKFDNDNSGSAALSYRIANSNSEFLTVETRLIPLFQHVQVFPASDGLRRREGTWLEVKVPAGVGRVRLLWRYGGSNQPSWGGQFVVTLNEHG